MLLLKPRLELPEVVGRLWDKYNLPENVRMHCRAVAELAVRIAEAARVRGYDVDIEAVRLGALLHDIGRAYSHGLDHFVISGEILRKEGLDEKIIRIAERHFSSGITAEEAKALGLPAKDFMPETLEEKIVAFADNLIFGDRVGSFEEFMKRLDSIQENRWIVERSKERAVRLKAEIERVSGLKF
ncbi:TIGR00295 family protein [Archaeoglobus veneficus]|uniref:Metal dependent phosphohydrolase n=1 Tax=Archaeoglobus veneficus (strain DSM 11195 / SNP6) TaxID=693661 RepID=F2KQR4_ARCVS|nr:TIGR00295 family protein [Archaeoglobus veneficus]AEA46626.1 metal dependent phosphohydrolase [Archaeoglobus veneficus SNP6]